MRVSVRVSSCRDRLEQALLRIADPAGEGARACLTVYAQTARAAADAADARAARGESLSPLDGAKKRTCYPCIPDGGGCVLDAREVTGVRRIEHWLLM